MRSSLLALSLDLTVPFIQNGFVRNESALSIDDANGLFPRDSPGHYKPAPIRTVHDDAFAGLRRWLKYAGEHAGTPQLVNVVLGRQNIKMQ